MHGGSRENFWKTGGKLSQELKMTCHNTTRTDRTLQQRQERKSNLSPIADNDRRFRSWSNNRTIVVWRALYARFLSGVQKTRSMKKMIGGVLYIIILPNCRQVSAVFPWICRVALPYLKRFDCSCSRKITEVSRMALASVTAWGLVQRCGLQYLGHRHEKNIILRVPENIFGKIFILIWFSFIRTIGFILG
jgi:hypothetical protein